jgi:hypothetical protein
MKSIVALFAPAARPLSLHLEAAAVNRPVAASRAKHKRFLNVLLNALGAFSA